MYGFGVVTRRGKLSKIGQDVLVLRTKDGFSEYNIPYQNKIMFTINDRKDKNSLKKKVVIVDIYFSLFALASLLKHVRRAAVQRTARQEAKAKRKNSKRNISVCVSVMQN